MRVVEDVDTFRPISKGLNQMLIGTKLRVPSQRLRMIPRGHLVDRLSAGKDCRLTMISGPAGSGKTSLACQWIRQCKPPAAWYSLDKTDDEFYNFSRYLLAALSSIDDGFAAAVEQCLQEQKRLSTGEIIPFVIQHLNNLPEDKYLVLDNYHVITSKEIHNELLYFLAHMPPKMHLVIISRNSIPFSISQFRVRDQITEISAEDLRFTGKEMELFIIDFIPVKLSADEAHELDLYTEGWIGAVELFVSALKGKATSGLNEILGKVCQEAADFLIDEVIDGQQEKVKAFLYTTVFLDRFNADLCREVTGDADASELLEQLCRNNLYLVPLNPERTWYRYHHLFSKAIRERLTISSPDKVRHVHQKVALWFARNCYMEDAFKHSFASGDFEFAADLLENPRLSFFDCYGVDFYLGWLAKLPREIVMDRPLLRLYECIFKIESFRLLEIDAIIKDIEENQAFERYQGPKKTLCMDFLSYCKYVLPLYRALYRNNASGDVDQLKQFPRMISPVDKSLSGIMKVILSRCYFFHGNISLTGDILKDAAKSIFLSDSIWARILWYKHMAEAERWQGHLHRAEALSQEGFLFLERKGLSDIRLKFLLYQQMAWVYYYRNNLEKVLEYLSIASRFAEQTGSLTSIIEAAFLQTHIYIDTGEVEKADQCIQKIHRVSKATGNPDAIAITEAYIAFLLIARKDSGWGEKWANRRKLSMDEPFSFPFVYECLAQIRLFYIQGRYREAVNMSETLRSRCVERNMMERVLEIDLILSAALYELNDRDRAKTIMEQVLIFSEAQGYIQPFIHYGAMIMPVLIDMKKIPGIGRRASKMVNIINSSCSDRYDSEVQKQFAGFKDNNLTPRETEILKLIAGGYKNKEIAEKVFVSLDTVKSHTRNIFRKLDVKTRVQAIRQAEEHRLFEIQ